MIANETQSAGESESCQCRPHEFPPLEGRKKQINPDAIRHARFCAEVELRCMSLLMAQSGHHDRPERCPLLGVKRTFDDSASQYNL